MTSDFEMVTTVKREFARCLPSDLVALVLEFANWESYEAKQRCVEFVNKMRKLLNEIYEWLSWVPQGRTTIRCRSQFFGEPYPWVTYIEHKPTPRMF